MVWLVCKLSIIYDVFFMLVCSCLTCTNCWCYICGFLIGERMPNTQLGLKCPLLSCYQLKSNKKFHYVINKVLTYLLQVFCAEVDIVHSLNNLDVRFIMQQNQCLPQSAKLHCLVWFRFYIGQIYCHLSL